MTDARLSGGTLRGAVDLSGLVRAAQAPAPAAGAAPAPTGLMRDVDDVSFGEVVEQSRTVPVVVEFYADGIAPVLGPIIASYGGRLALATVDGNRSPQVAQAFQIQQVPAVVALVGGRPLPLFVGMPSEPEVRQVLDQVLELAAQNGVTGSIPVDGDEEGAEPVEPPLPPLHQEAYDAISAGDYAAAATAYRTAIAQNPRDQLAVAGLAQVSLLQRLEGLVAADVRAAAAAAPDDADAQLAVADLDLSGGHVDDAFARLLRVFPGQQAEAKATIRARFLDYFEIVGADDPRTIAGRRALTNLLY
ncbi:tetratricopeptide repeat protein [Microcella humidisoli]|uniref:Tetratricopeptide repeat protein n=1 Tax=Microcella humidisoli TaxID=2963406 RepID=A0ABY5FUI6_9MICO|nr:tetratricopeptide repeat protein [Microcella humidisoli]UTT61826.1 tetratricopeptide repeat protein [Microcella humidisoli]